MLDQSFFDHVERTPLAEELGYPDSRIDVTINPTTETVRFYAREEASASTSSTSSPTQGDADEVSSESGSPDEGDDPTEAAITAPADDFVPNVEDMR